MQGNSSENSEIDFPKDESDSEIIEVINEIDPLSLGSLRLAVGTAESEINDLTHYTYNSRHLLPIATNLTTLLSCPGTFRYDQESRQTILTAIQFFIHEITAYDETEVSMNISELNNSQVELRRTQEELIETQRNLETASRKAQREERSNRQMQEEIRAMNEEFESWHRENMENTEKLNRIRRENEIELEQLKGKLDKYQEECRKLKDRVKYDKFANQRLQSQLDASNEEISALQKEVFKLKSDVQAKSEKSNELDSVMRKHMLRIEELETDNQKLAMYANELKRNYQTVKHSQAQTGSERVRLLQKDNEKLRDAVSRMNSLLEAQTDQITDLNNRWKHATSVIEKLSHAVNEYDHRLNEADTAKTRSEMKLRLVESEMSDARKTMERKSREGPIVNKVRQISGKKSESEMMEYLSEIGKLGDVLQISKQNAVLRSVVDNQTKFLSESAKNGVLETACLRGTGSIAYKERNSLLVEIARTKQFLSQNGINVEPIEDEQQALIDLCGNDSLYSVLSAQQSQFRLLKEYIRELKKELHENRDTIAKVANELHCCNDSDAVVSGAAEIVREHQSLVDQLVDIIPVDDANMNECIIDFVRNADAAVRFLDGEVRQLLRFDGGINELLTCIYEELAESDSAKVTEIQAMKNSITELRQQLAVEIEQSSEYIHSLETQVSTKDAKIKQITDELDRTKSSLETTKEECITLKSFNESISARSAAVVEEHRQLEKDLERLRSEKKKMENLLAQKTEMFDRRIEKIISEQQESHKKEILMHKEHAEAKQKQTEALLKQKKQQVSTLKAKLKEVMATYDAAFKKQKEAVASMRQQNDELSRQIMTERESHISQNMSGNHDTIDQLKEEIQSLNSEKLMLKLQIDQLDDKCQKIQSMRDAYWQSQMSLQESQIRRELRGTKGHGNLLEEIAQKISRLTKRPIESTVENVVEGITYLVNRVYDLEAHISELQRRISDVA